MSLRETAAATIVNTLNYVSLDRPCRSFHAYGTIFLEGQIDVFCRILHAAIGERYTE
jgi:hypothetical protein